MAGIVLIPDSIAGADPGRCNILGVPVAGEGLVAVGTDLVHLGEVIRQQHVIRIEDHIAIKLIPAVIFVDALQQVVQSVALANLFGIEPGVDYSTVFPGNISSSVRTVIGHHKGGDQVGGVILVLDTVEQVRDDALLVSCCDEHSKTVLLYATGGALVLALGDDIGHEQISYLIEKHDAHNKNENCADSLQNFKHNGFSFIYL